MSSALVSKMRDDIAPRLIAKLAGNGGVAVAVRVVTPDPDPLEPPVESQSSQPISAFAKGVSATMLTADPNLQATDLRVIVAAVEYDPKVGDVVLVNGLSRRVIRVDAIPAADLPAAYWFYVR